ncbi:bifunctional 4-hydroxy-2-oxoglutarate aldolase/2-dehydro-3-deoxy-phosphogluconate aldolase [Aquibaculum sediminis]|uniref:bifunctional 4-hydroxy-2-oxoglutarate aldolase/2-dehydro-3-deoxy-phosphogluconate aldolase n=1 Tax=Aquibaculum sediminis TaxID=3231907 RepID=UPI003453CB83
MTLAMASLLDRAPVIPVLTLERVEDAVPLGKALLAGGLPVIEITLRSAAALDAARALIQALPDALVGLGTVLERAQLRAAAEIGAAFAVSPGASDGLLQAAREEGMPPLLPGAATAGEVMTLREAGYRDMKFFPAEVAGGIAWLKAVQPVFPDCRFCPTGGVSAERAPDYLALGNVACVGGSWIAPAAAIRQGAWEEIEQRARAAAGVKR